MTGIINSLRDLAADLEDRNVAIREVQVINAISDAADALESSIPLLVLQEHQYMEFGDFFSCVDSTGTYCCTLKEPLWNSYLAHLQEQAKR